MAEINTISSNMYLSQKPDDRKVGNNLGKDEFLKILMTQLQNQDPTNPMKDNEFIAQMAQFSSLEQMTNMTQSFEKFASGQQQTQLIQYNTFVGKQIKWHELTDKFDENNKPIINTGTGTIGSVKFLDGSVEFTLEDGKKINPGNISEVISSGASANSLVEASMLIGKTIGYKDIDTEKSGQVVSVSNKDGKINFILADGSKITSDQFSSISQ